MVKMKPKNLLLVLIFIFPVQVLSKDLPHGHQLLQNEKGDYYVINSQKITMIEPAIITMGYDRKWILACIKNRSIDSDEKRMVCVNLKNGGTVDTIRRENWENFKGIYPELTGIKLEPLLDEPCP